MAIERTGVVLGETGVVRGHEQLTRYEWFHLPGKSYDETIAALVKAKFEPVSRIQDGPYVEIVQAKDGVEFDGDRPYYGLPGSSYEETRKALEDAEFKRLDWQVELSLDKQGLKPDA